MSQGYDQAEDEAIEALEQGQDINEPSETPESADDSGSPENTADTQETQVEGAQPQPAADDFDPGKWALKFRGREIRPRDRTHLINLAQQGYLYSQRAQDLKQREEQLQQQAAEYDQYKKLAEAFRTNPTLQQKIMGLYHEAQGQGQRSQQPQQQQPDVGSVLPQIQPYLQKIEQLEQRLASYDNRQADQELKNELSQLRERYPNAAWDQPNEEGRTFAWEVLNHAHKNNFRTLEQAYRDLMWDSMQTQTKAETLKQQAQQQQKLHRQGVVAGKATQAPPAKAGPDIRSMNYDKIAEAVIAGDLR